MMLGLTKLAHYILEAIRQSGVADRTQGVDEDVQFGWSDDQMDLAWIDIRPRLRIGIGHVLA
jgi:hypothetical protein